MAKEAGKRSPAVASARPAPSRPGTGLRKGGDVTFLRDEVGTIVAQWQRERPDLDPAPMTLFGHLARAHLLTTPYITAIVAEHGLNRGTFDVLSALRRAGRPFSLTPRQLADSLMLSGAGMSNRLDRLEAALLVARLPDPADRRSVLIQLTQRGVALIDAIIPSIIAAQWRVVSGLGRDETATLVDLLRRLGHVLSGSPGVHEDEPELTPDGARP